MLWRIEIVELLEDEGGSYEADDDYPPNGVVIVDEPTRAKAVREAKAAADKCDDEVGAFHSYRDPVAVDTHECIKCAHTFRSDQLRAGMATDEWGNDAVGNWDNVLACRECQPDWFEAPLLRVARCECVLCVPVEVAS